MIGYSGTMRLSLIASLLPPAFITSFALAAICPPDGISRGVLEKLKDNKFEVTDDAYRQSVGLALVGCLGSRDPALRDAIAFTATLH